MSTPYKMEYVTFGNTGLKVSRLGFGLMTLVDVDQAIALLETARDYGCNFFDNAEAYGNPRGTCELIFGEAYGILRKMNPFKWRRSDLVITTKIYFGVNGAKTQNALDQSVIGENELGLSAKHIHEGLRGALKRTGLDYFDVVYAHRYDNCTPMVEIVRAFTKIIRDGKAFYWGTSMWPSHRVLEAYWIAKCYDLIPPVVEQCKHSMLCRQYVEKEYLALFDAPYHLATTVWGGLDSGILTGKYLNNQMPSNSRLHKNDRLSLFYPKIPQWKHDKVAQLKAFAESELNTSVAQLALAWCMKNPNVTVIIVGAKRDEQLNVFECMDVVQKLDEDKMKKIEQILENKPELDAGLYSNFGRSKRSFRKAKL
eukprot:342804_1